LSRIGIEFCYTRHMAGQSNSSGINFMDFGSDNLAYWLVEYYRSNKLGIVSFKLSCYQSCVFGIRTC